MKETEVMALADKRMANANTVQKKALGLQNELNENSCNNS